MKQFNMKNLVIAVLVSVLGFLGYNVSQNNLGSIGQVAYMSTTTDATWNATNFPTKTKVLKTGNGYLGSIIVTGATTATVMNCYDATTTLAHLNHPTTSIAQIGASTIAGTYTFDTSFARGLICEFPSALGAPTSTISWR